LSFARPAGEDFLVDDFDTGVAALINSTLEDAATGGVVTYCEAIDIVSAKAGI
jgi:hypothetical protein